MSVIKKGDTIVVWFSCGAASAVAAKKTIDIYGDIANIRIVNNPIDEEHSDNMRFLKDVETWLGYPIEFATNPTFPGSKCVDVWEKRKYMSGIKGAPCTMLLKKQARVLWEKDNHHDWLVMGFTADGKEILRHERFVMTERENLIPVLINEGLTKADCFRILLDEGLKLPEIYNMGYPNANCIGCVKVASPTYWNHVRLKHPSIFEQRSLMSRRLKSKLVVYKGERIFLDELDPLVKSRPMRDIDFECGIFCEEKFSLKSKITPKRRIDVLEFAI